MTGAAHSRRRSPLSPEDRQLRQDLVRLVHETVAAALPPAADDAKAARFHFYVRIGQVVGHAIADHEERFHIPLFSAVATIVERLIVDHEERLHGAPATPRGPRRRSTP